MWPSRGVKEGAVGSVPEGGSDDEVGGAGFVFADGEGHAVGGGRALEGFDDAADADAGLAGPCAYGGCGVGAETGEVVSEVVEGVDGGARRGQIGQGGLAGGHDG
jgi:hypothetical protein